MKIPMSKDAGGDILAIFIAILMFQAIPHFPIFKNVFQEQPYIVFLVAVLLLVYRRKIISLFGKK